MSTATTASEPTAQDIPDKPHQLSANYKFHMQANVWAEETSISCLPVCVVQPVAISALQFSERCGLLPHFFGCFQAEEDV